LKPLLLRVTAIFLTQGATPVKTEVHVVVLLTVTVVDVFINLSVVDVVVATNSVIVDVSVFSVSLEAL